MTSRTHTLLLALGLAVFASGCFELTREMSFTLRDDPQVAIPDGDPNGVLRSAVAPPDALPAPLIRATLIVLFSHPEPSELQFRLTRFGDDDIVCGMRGMGDTERCQLELIDEDLETTLLRWTFAIQGIEGLEMAGTWGVTAIDATPGAAGRFDSWTLRGITRAVDRPPTLGFERDEIACADGRDNDLDGLVDCQDPDCLRWGHCGQQIIEGLRREREDTFDLCIDGIDNDEDGRFDCGDPKCQNILELCCLTELTDTLCSDGIDNDGNGQTDCADFSCRNSPFVTVCRRETICDDGIDNDGDRLTDCADPDCFCDSACNPGCPGPENTLERCQDGFDNDGDGFTDCADFSCSRVDRGATPEAAAFCATLPDENTVELCSDGIDNDRDGFIDCADFSCINPERGATPAAVAFCDEILENTLEKCSDGIDNDGNGFADCADFSCARSDDCQIRAYCALQGERSFDRCTDRIDHDGNGFTDCQDFSCRGLAPEYVCVRESDQEIVGFCECPCDEAGGEEARQECLACPEGFCPGGLLPRACPDGARCIPRRPCLESFGSPAQAIANCTDGIDNDGDGFIDCEDWDCNHNPAVVNPDGTPLCANARGRRLVCP